MTRVAYVYPNSRRALLAGWRKGVSPDTHLLGLNQLPEFGITAEAREPRLASRGTGLAARTAWHLRELGLPWELGDYDVIFTPLANVVPLASRLRRRPRVLVFNFGLNTILRRANGARRRLLLAALRASAGVVCLGESQRRELIELSDLDPAHVAVAVHGVDEQFFDPAGAPAGDAVVAVGKDLARDFATLVAAVRTLAVRVVLVTLPRNLAGIDLPPNVEVRERISDVELRSTYAEAACVVLPLQPAGYPYGSEGSGVSGMLEAQAMARPLVVSERPIEREYVRDGETATIVPPADADTLRRAIELQLADRDAAGARGHAGRRLVEAEHTMHRMAADLAPLLEAAARGRPLGPA